VPAKVDVAPCPAPGKKAQEALSVATCEIKNGAACFSVENAVGWSRAIELVSGGWQRSSRSQSSKNEKSNK